MGQTRSLAPASRLPCRAGNAVAVSPLSLGVGVLPAASLQLLTHPRAAGSSL